MNDLQKIFQGLRDLLSACSAELTFTTDTETRFDLYSLKEVVYLNRRFSEVYFGGAALRTGYVAFYFMPLYMAQPTVTPALAKLQKGKSCFHLQKYDVEVMKEIEALIAEGYEQFRTSGLI